MGVPNRSTAAFLTLQAVTDLTRELSREWHPVSQVVDRAIELGWTGKVVTLERHTRRRMSGAFDEWGTAYDDLECEEDAVRLNPAPTAPYPVRPD